MKKLNSLAIRCEADKTDAEIHHITRNGTTYAVTAHCRDDAEDAVTAHLATPAPDGITQDSYGPEMDLPLP